MDIASFLALKEFDGIDERIRDVQHQMELNRFNLFTISSYNSYLENFHSDVIKLLLDPQERHGHHSVFLDLFLDYLISLGARIDKSQYTLCELTRERGNIDIWIKDPTSKRSIIIENKINNASDMENQLENYYNYAHLCGFQVDSILYITLHSNKNAPWTDNIELNSKILNISAFKNNDDLCQGWLEKCYEMAADEHSRSFIFQYLKLIKHLSQHGMDREIKEDFYKIVSSAEGYQKAKAVASLVAGLDQYRTDLLVEKINGDYAPFKKIYRYRPNHQLFERYHDNDILFKVDVQLLSGGNAQIDFWNPDQPHEIQKHNVSEKLKSLGLYDDFEHGGAGGGMYRYFDSGKIGSIEEVDKELFYYLMAFFKKLR
ncbi:hypothetical protein L1276_002558 [Flavobacterium sp. HSC-32F16]|uniref:PD-(D/E)XK nuclease family protein n=1 Tax=Flavobacterium sp. HSC-32F16 TaxID=2910964 RepID=UPI0020A2EDC1|nr:PD-(D/E)XK nuclease family protein [Flavobacterium sp. HSC-32F16]MCP2027401.1 hypothetical protein [Flavobacterium sp. HSC-32F16]